MVENITKRDVERDIAAIFASDEMSRIVIFCRAKKLRIVTLFLFVGNCPFKEEPYFACCPLFLWTFSLCVRIIRACCRRASTASTTQHSASSAHQAAKQVRADQSATTQASRRRLRRPECRRAFVQLAVFSKRTEKSKSARSTGSTKVFYLGVLGICKSPV